MSNTREPLMFTRGDRSRRSVARPIAATIAPCINIHATVRATVHATAVSPTIARIKHRPNFVRSNVRLSHRLCKFQPITDQRNATQTWRLCGVWTSLSNWSILSYWISYKHSACMYSQNWNGFALSFCICTTNRALWLRPLADNGWCVVPVAVQHSSILSIRYDGLY